MARHWIPIQPYNDALTVAHIERRLRVVTLFAKTLPILLVVNVEVVAALLKRQDVIELRRGPNAWRLALLAVNAQRVAIEPVRADALELAAAQAISQDSHPRRDRLA